ncbi:MAG TPA: putative 2-aminoethylphosphonate ABC transporter substrate-binding protein [Beijerinckiaceae bacterium]|nr:putative 2-aminoethylphosphonate ABC transporter substrate-binding protein [Beijerinckiaceae bacterium]
MINRTLAWTLGAALALALSGFGAAAQKTRITVYTAIENDQLGPYKQAFEAENPDVEISWVRDSTGVITARFLAEKDNPRADAIWGLAATSLLLFEQANLLEPYEPKGLKELKSQFRDPDPPTTWTGMDAWLAVVCYNSAEGAKAKATRPTSWADLVKPEYKGQVVMPHPASSGTGYLVIAAWLQVMGEEKAWRFMDDLHQNIAVYTHSGSAPCVQAARGERLVGIGFDMRAASEKAKGAPIDIVIPSEGVGWDMEATAIVRGTKNLEAAKKLADFSASRKANELYAKYYALVAHPDVKAAPPHYPPEGERMMIKNDFSWMAQNRERILAEWSKRYEAKAQPK